MEWAEIALKFVQAAANVFVAYLAFQGLHQWKKKLKGAEQHETAKKILRCFLDIRTKMENGFSPSFTEEENAVHSKFAGILKRLPEGSGPAVEPAKALFTASMRKKAAQVELETLRTEVLMGRFVLGGDLKVELQTVDELINAYGDALKSFTEDVAQFSTLTADFMKTAVNVEGVELGEVPPLPIMPQDFRRKLDSATDTFSAALAKFGIGS